MWWPKWAILGEIWGARDGFFEWAKSEKSGEVKILPLCTAGGTGGRRHHPCNGRGVVAAPAWLLAPDWRDLDRRREIEEGMSPTKMHKNTETHEKLKN